ncbi:deoxyribose-phosphate aldolase [Carboxydochorda subterranea]|uniref:Deoxyribose-phosphate aldolase n=1 Tax=Carboxydichorda subterranea TaxID=3109565 RepID=A0ABZ1BUR1_9FIRM|nr:deoxyribose-phosphate aldolase [Limnochorda sp. L945t]WRP16424.1 deoxyribose-phosphate aldolase [Limnochorda sp. L945t]
MSPLAREVTPEAMARMIDHTLLKPEARPEDVEGLCREAVEWGFGAVCVNPLYVRRAVRALEGHPVKVAVVVGFPLGATTVLTRVVEAVEAVAAGAREVDMVAPAGLLLAGDEGGYAEAIRAVARAIGGDVILKVILETGLLPSAEWKRRAALVAVREGAHFVKTSTGFGPGGATVDDVRLLAEAVAGRAGVKASGGIRTAEAALQMVEAGATRIGTSSGVAILREMRGLR